VGAGLVEVSEGFGSVGGASASVEAVCAPVSGDCISWGCASVDDGAEELNCDVPPFVALGAAFLDLFFGAETAVSELGAFLFPILRVAKEEKRGGKMQDL